MPREDWHDLERDRLRRLRDREHDHDRGRDRRDFGQADYSNLYGYDPRTRSGYRAYEDGRGYDEGRSYGDNRRLDESRAYEDRRPYDEDPRHLDEREAGRRHGNHDRDWENGRDHRRSRRDGPSDRVLWAVITERLEDERRLDLREVEVEVHDGEVTLNGTVRHKADKRRIEDVADIDGVRHVQNNLRVRESNRRWTFL